MTSWTITFLEIADAAVEGLGYGGVLQVASFHPQYQFAGTSIDDVTNATNRSHYPTLHLLREDSIDRAVAAFPEAETIYETNMRTLEKLGKRVGLICWRRVVGVEFDYFSRSSFP